jgi:serine phosphatase RsbU (regulator of sigma subunit)
MNRIRFHLNWLEKAVKFLISDNDDHFSLERINSNTFLFAASLISILSCVFNFIEGFSLILNIFTIISSILLVVLYYLSRFRNYSNIWLSANTVLLLLSVSWFMNGGAIGSTSFMYLFTVIILNIIAKPHQQNGLFLLVLANIAVLYAMEYLFGSLLVHRYPDVETYYSDIIFVFVLILFGVFFTTRFIKRSYDEGRNLVNEQKMIIEKQNKEHLESLTYASYLQKKIMPGENKLCMLFSDYFVLFQPKDIVSGDFYWIKERGNYGVVVVADCTGHGVPAAFLSVIGISLLEEIVNQEKEELNAAAILEKLRNRFISYLQNNSSGEESKDGIDLGICVVNYEASTFQFSSANRPLILIRGNQYPEAVGYAEKEVKGDYTLYSYKATKNIIGLNYREFSFTNIDIEVFSRDTFYLFSDGFADQFDYMNKKKFKMSQLKKELLQIQDLSLSAQAEYLSDIHLKWRGHTFQTDDIVLIGLRM